MSNLNDATVDDFLKELNRRGYAAALLMVPHDRPTYFYEFSNCGEEGLSSLITRSSLGFYLHGPVSPLDYGKPYLDVEEVPFD